MLRRLLCFLMILMLLPFQFAFAGEEADDMPTFFLMVDRYEGVDYPMGTAVLFGDDATLFTSLWSIQFYGEIIAVGPDGEHAVTGAYGISEDSEAVLLDIEPAYPAGTPAQLHYADDEMSMTRMAGYDADGSFRDVPLTAAEPLLYGGDSAVLAVCETPLLTGAVLLDDLNRIAGLMIAEWNDLPNRYAALTHDAIVNDLLGSEMILKNDAAPSGHVWAPQPPVLSYDAGLLKADWSGLGFEDEAIASYTLYFADTANYHYSYAEYTDGSTSDLIPVVPGRSYVVWMDITTVSGGKPINQPERYASIYTIPAAPQLTDYGFRHVSASLASVPAGTEVEGNAALPILRQVTGDILRDPDRRFYLQVINTYQVTEQIQADMMIALTTPENRIFTLPSGYIYMPELNEKDLWNAEVTSLFQECLQFSGHEDFVPGLYTLDYYIGGAYAGGVTFHLQ